MRKLLCHLLLGVTLCLLVVPPIWADQGQPVLAEGRKVNENKAYQAAIFRVTLSEQYGSGFAISPDLVVTCFHVMELENGTVMSRASLVSGTGRKYSGDVVTLDSANDIAILRLDSKVDVFFKLADNDAAQGAKVAAIKTRIEYIAKFTRCEIQEIWDTYLGYANRYAGTLTKGMEFGNSGSPVVNADYEVVGIIMAVLIKDNMRGVYGGVSNLKKLLSKSGLVQ